MVLLYDFRCGKVGDFISPSANLQNSCQLSLPDASLPACNYILRAPLAHGSVKIKSSAGTGILVGQDEETVPSVGLGGWESHELRNHVGHLEVICYGDVARRSH